MSGIQLHWVGNIFYSLFTNIFINVTFYNVLKIFLTVFTYMKSSVHLFALWTLKRREN